MTATDVTPMTDDAVLHQRAAALGAATLHEASGGLGALPVALGPITQGLVLAGRAVTVSGPGADNLWLHEAVATCGPGDVLVAHVDESYESGYWGEVLSWAARARGIAGVVIDGCVRDSDRLTQIGVPVFARGTCIRGTTKRPDGPGAINEPLRIGQVEITPGDLVVGDSDGLVAIARGLAAEVVEAGIVRADHEAAIIIELQRGGLTQSLLGLPRVAAARANDVSD